MADILTLERRCGPWWLYALTTTTMTSRYRKRFRCLYALSALGRW